jgi:hypothetical protein
MDVPRFRQVDSSPAHRDAFVPEQSQLRLALDDASVGVNDAMPGNFLGRRREHAAG